jgi:hypothetical protein
VSQAVLTPTAGRVLKRSLFWLGVIAFVAVVVVIVLGTAGSQAGGTRLDPGNAAPPGTRAVAEVLRQQGVTVTATSTLVETRGAVRDPGSTTLLVYDPGLYLTDEQLQSVVGIAETVVIADASFDELRAIAPELALAGYAGGTLEADCDLPAARKAGTVTSDGDGYRLVDDADGAITCFGSGDGVHALVQLERGGTRLVVLGATSALTNQHVVEEGNAALALNLLGENPDLVWYLPTIDDVQSDAPADLGSLSPAWLTPALTLLVLTFVVGAVWRGRRFGPLVVENLPVTVRASETMLGRARLYQKSSARLRALDALRIGSLQRLAVLCGLPRTASVDDVVASVAGATGEQVTAIRRLLVDAVLASDAELVVLSDELLELERDVAAAVRP